LKNKIHILNLEEKKNQEREESKFKKIELKYNEK